MSRLLRATEPASIRPVGGGHRRPDAVDLAAGAMPTAEFIAAIVEYAVAHIPRGSPLLRAPMPLRPRPTPADDAGPEGDPAPLPTVLDGCVFDTCDGPPAYMVK